MELYNKIDSIICYIGDAALKMNVILTDTNKKDKLRNLSYHMETDFYSKAADCRMVNIKLSMKYFLTLEGFKDINGQRPYIMITPANIIKIRESFHNYLDNIFYDGNTFVIENGNLCFRRGKKPILIDGLPFEKYLVLAPDMGVNRDNINYKATKLFLSSRDNYLYLTESQLLELVYAFDSINMYQSALSLVNYFGRPPEGTNRFIVKY
jgi:hypothetical protein